MPLVIVQGLLTAFSIYLAFHVSIYPVDQRTKKRKKRLAVIFSAICAGMFICALLQYTDSKKDELAAKRNFDEQIKSFKTNDDIKSAELAFQIGDVKSNLNVANNLRQKYEWLVQTVLTNMAINADTRLRIIEFDRTNSEFLNSRLDDLNAWEAALKSNFRDIRASAQIQTESELKRQQANYLKFRPCFDFVISTLVEGSEKVASVRGDKVVAESRGLPSTIYPDGLKEGNIANITMKTNAIWHVRARLSIDSFTHEARIDINGNNSVLCVSANGDFEMGIEGVYHAREALNKASFWDFDF